MVLKKKLFSLYFKSDQTIEALGDIQTKRIIEKQFV